MTDQPQAGARPAGSPASAGGGFPASAGGRFPASAGGGFPASAGGGSPASAGGGFPASAGGGFPLAGAYDVALLDLDGVVYLGSSAVPGAPEALAAARRAGMRLAFVTNNASRSPSAIAAQLTGLGVAAAASDVVTSAQAAATLLAARLPAGAPVLVSGGMGLRLALRERGLRPVSTAAENPAAVVQGFAQDLSYGLLAEAAVAVAAGAWFVATNADVTLPTRRGPQPGNGSLAGMITAATGTRPDVAGKPEPPLHAEAVARTGAGRPLIVGDRLDTDIEGAVRAGADSLLVLTGVTGPAQLLLAPPERRPSYVSCDLAGLLEPHPQVSGEGTAFCCGGWEARPEAGRLHLDGAGQAIDGLRALAAAAWSAPGGLSREAADAAAGLLHLAPPGHPQG